MRKPETVQEFLSQRLEVMMKRIERCQERFPKNRIAFLDSVAAYVGYRMLFEAERGGDADSLVAISMRALDIMNEMIKPSKKAKVISIFPHLRKRWENK